MTNTRSKTLLWLLTAFVVSAAAMVVIGMVAYQGTDSGYDNYGMMGGGWGWAMGLMVVPGIILILILVVALGGLGDRQDCSTYPVYPQPQQSPLDILNQRLARGEIDSDEYQRIRTKLGQ